MLRNLKLHIFPYIRACGTCGTDRLTHRDVIVCARHILQRCSLPTARLGTKPSEHALSPCGPGHRLGVEELVGEVTPQRHHTAGR